MSRVWRTIKGYLFWTYERGSFHYDVMVTLILAFIFITPYYVNFKDKPTAHATHPKQIIVNADGQNGFVYEISSDQVTQSSDMKAELVRALESTVGNVVISRYESLRDARGRIIAYRAWGHRE
jgi:hypothetical protein